MARSFGIRSFAVGLLAGLGLGFVAASLRGDEATGEDAPEIERANPGNAPRRDDSRPEIESRPAATSVTGPESDATPMRDSVTALTEAAIRGRFASSRESR